MQQISLTVRQLNLYVRSLLEGDSHLTSLTLEGELSNFKNHYSSGHWYFVLKDSDAAVRGVMFKANAMRVDFEPKDGMRVICKGYVSLYEKDGQFQFYAESMRPFGEGDLAAEFERIKKKLEAEGLFSADRKRALPQFPKQIGVVTSETGAALQDILQILSRRYPICDIKIYPALVQGVGAPKSIISALGLAYNSDCDVIIVGRGGGSAEDLSCFNDEELARTVAKSPVPVISAVGHEIDFTICDFVSDLRAPTPSAAAELVTPDLYELLSKIENLNTRIKSCLSQKIGSFEQQIKQITTRRCFAYPELLFSPYELRLDLAIDKFKTAYLFKINSNELKFETLKNKFFALSPHKILERGFSAVYNGKKIIKSVNDINLDDILNVKLSDGLVECKVISVSKEESQ